MLIQLPNKTWVNPKSVQNIVAIEASGKVSVMLSTWNNFGNHFELLEPAEGQTVEELRDDVVLQINEACHADQLQ